MSVTNQRLATWGGVIGIAIVLIAQWAIAGFVPPPGPGLSVAEIVRIYTENATRIRAGIIIAGAACTLIVPWTLVIAVQIRRIEGEHPLLSGIQAVLGGLLLIEFYIPYVIWMAAAYRPDLDPVLTYRLHDLGSITFDALPWTGALQAVVLGIATLQDRASDPIFPRWLGYLSFFSACSFLPGGLNALAKTGPLAWNGLLAWWLGLAVFGIWITAVTVCLLRYALPHQQRTEQAAPRNLQAVGGN